MNRAEEAFIEQIEKVMKKFKVTLDKCDCYDGSESYCGTDYRFRCYHKLDIDIDISEITE